jgi:hypothetical protein
MKEQLAEIRKLTTVPPEVGPAVTQLAAIDI